MIVYHGTGGYNLPSIQSNGLEVRRRKYVRRKCACTTTDFAIAELFAIRHTPSDDFMNGLVSGVVLEYHLSGVTGRDHAPARDASALQEEAEIAVFNVRTLRLVAVWRNIKDKWTRELADTRCVPEETADAKVGTET